LRLEIDVGEIPPSAKKLILEAHRERRQSGQAAPNWKLEKIAELILRREKKASRLWLPR
jgi:hypothetical protein